MPHPWATDRAVRAIIARFRHLNRKTPMEQLHLPSVELTVNVEAFLGLTNWVNAAEKLPPTNGWWKTRRVSSPKLLQPQRRWFDGASFSMPVLRVDDDAYAEVAATRDTTIPLSDIEWCGLRAPHPLWYPYRLYNLNPEDRDG